MAIREVKLPERNKGHLCLSSMPGRYEPFAEAISDIVYCQINRIICLCSDEELEESCIQYYSALNNNTLPCRVTRFPIPDRGVPHDKNAFLNLCQDISRSLAIGQNILLHCNAGIGRTGMLAISVMLALGFNLENAYEEVTVAGSYPQDSEQQQFLIWVSKRFAK